jgi:hypothetical protein
LRRSVPRGACHRGQAGRSRERRARPQHFHLARTMPRSRVQRHRCWIAGEHHTGDVCFDRGLDDNGHGPRGPLAPSGRDMRWRSGLSRLARRVPLALKRTTARSSPTLRRAIHKADASAGITTEDHARDLETVASEPGVPTERDLLMELLRRVRRIEERLGIESSGPYDEYLSYP